MIRLITITFLLTLSWSLSGQNYFTLKLAASLANQSGTGGSIQVGVATGLGYEYQISDKLWIASGVDFVNKGTVIGVVANVTQYGRRVNYYEVPLSVKYKYFFSPNFQWGVYGGANIGFNSSGKDRFFSLAQPVERDIAGEGLVESTEIGVHIGAELNFAVDYGQFSIFAQYQPSLTTAVMDPLFGIDVKNNILQTGFLVKFGKEAINPYDKSE